VGRYGRFLLARWNQSTGVAISADPADSTAAIRISFVSLIPFGKIRCIHWQHVGPLLRTTPTMPPATHRACRFAAEAAKTNGLSMLFDGSGIAPVAETSDGCPFSSSRPCARHSSRRELSTCPNGYRSWPGLDSEPHDQRGGLGESRPNRKTRAVRITVGCEIDPVTLHLLRDR
jgi:hypothetical protein